MNRRWGAAVHSVQPGEGPMLALVRAWFAVRRRVRGCFGKAAARTELVGHCPDCGHDVVDAAELRWVQNVCALRLPGGARPDAFHSPFGVVRLGHPELLCAFVGGVLGSAVALAVSVWLAPLACVPFAFTAWFFRNPTRRPPPDAELVLSPADGVVDDLRHEPEHEFFPGPAWRIGIYLSVFDVHVNRAPLAAVVQRCQYRPGRKVPTVRTGFTDANEQLLTHFTSDRGPCVVRQVAGPFARRICNVLGAGDAVAAGERFGLIKFGSRTELWLPAVPGVQLSIVCGQRVRAGETALARWRI